MCDGTSAKKLDKFIDSVTNKTPIAVDKFPVPERIIAIDKREKWYDVKNPPCEICQDYEDDEDNPALLCDGCSFGCAHVKCLKLETIPEEDWFCKVCTKKKQFNEL